MPLSGFAEVAAALAGVASLATARPAHDAQINKAPTAMTVQASGWIRVEYGGDAQVFYRRQPHAPHDELQRVYIKLERETPDAAYPHFLSKVSLVEFNCAAGTRRVILSTLYAGNNQSGRASIGARDAWAPITPGMVDDAVLKLICGRD